VLELAEPKADSEDREQLGVGRQARRANRTRKDR
jgi:hypothetical protein